MVVEVMEILVVEVIVRGVGEILAMEVVGMVSVGGGDSEADVGVDGDFVDVGVSEVGGGDFIIGGGRNGEGGGGGGDSEGGGGDFGDGGGR